MKNILFVISVLFLFSCDSDPKSISYGLDKCDLCSMHILDHKHATLLVTDKPDYLKFDSAECLMNYQKNATKINATEVLTNTVDTPNQLVDATKVIYLISKNLPSPMGANLNAYSTKELAEVAQKEHSGKLYTYEELKEYFKAQAPLKMHD